MANHKDGRITARENEIRVLRALHRCGWLRTRDLAALVWQDWARNPAGEPSLKPPTSTASGLRMAQRTLRRLRDKRLVLSSHAPDGSIIYALAARVPQFRAKNRGFLPWAPNRINNLAIKI